MSPKDNISRKDFLYKSGMMGTALVLTSILGMAKALAQDRKIKVAVIGCGSVTRMYFPHLSKSPYVELISAADIIPERAAKAAEEFAKGYALTGVGVRSSPLSSGRNIVDVIFSYANRNTDFTEKYSVRVDVTGEFPFLVTKILPYYER